MRLRAITALILLVLVFGVTGARIYGIGAESVNAAATGGSKSVNVAEIRGTVYDCNLEPLTNADTVYAAAAKPTQKAVSVLKKVLLYDEYKSVSERMLSGNPVVIGVSDPACECGDVKIIGYPERYSGSSACHIIGYLNSEGVGVSGIEKSYDAMLSGYGYTVNARFACDARGRVLLGKETEVRTTSPVHGGVVLTIDKNIQSATEKALDKAQIVCGAAVVIEVESGEIKASVSRPAFDPDNISGSLNNPDSPLINRAFLPFTVGSVFKPVVAAAAIESGIIDFKYNCTGGVTLNGVTFNCHKKDGHGVIGMEQAVANSCNTYFIALALETGAEKILETASDFGFGRAAKLAPSLTSSGGNLPSADELDSKAAVANISFGQGALTATPLQICAMMAAIARGGIYVEPSLVKGEVNAEGEFINPLSAKERIRVISSQTASLLKKYLESVVEWGSGKRAKSVYFSAAGKTATAQTGKAENGEEIYNAWFTGYFPADNPKYAVTILVENGGEGALSCAPVFKAISEQLSGVQTADYGAETVAE